MIHADLGPDVFARIEPEPLAAAPIGQIREAPLKDRREVVVKVRPGVLEQVDLDLDLDLDLLRSTVGVLERRSKTTRLLQLEALGDERSRTSAPSSTTSRRRTTPR